MGLIHTWALIALLAASTPYFNGVVPATLAAQSLASLLRGGNPLSHLTTLACGGAGEAVCVDLGEFAGVASATQNYLPVTKVVNIIIDAVIMIKKSYADGGLPFISLILSFDSAFKPGKRGTAYDAKPDAPYQAWTSDVFVGVCYRLFQLQLSNCVFPIPSGGDAENLLTLFQRLYSNVLPGWNLDSDLFAHGTPFVRYHRGWTTMPTPFFSAWDGLEVAALIILMYMKRHHIDLEDGDRSWPSMCAFAASFYLTGCDYDQLTNIKGVGITTSLTALVLMDQYDLDSILYDPRGFFSSFLGIFSSDLELMVEKNGPKWRYVLKHFLQVPILGQPMGSASRRDIELALKCEKATFERAGAFLLLKEEKERDAKRARITGGGDREEGEAEEGGEVGEGGGEDYIGGGGGGGGGSSPMLLEYGEAAAESGGGGGGGGGGGSGSSTSKTKGTSRSKKKPPVTQMTDGLLTKSAACQAVGTITFHLGGVPTTFEGIDAGYLALRESAGKLFSTPGPLHTGKKILARLQTECPYKVWSLPDASPLGYLAKNLGSLKINKGTAAAIEEFERLCKLVKLTPLEERCLADALERIVIGLLYLHPHK